MPNALVQLVRIHACHAWGHGFESRTGNAVDIITASAEQTGYLAQNTGRIFNQNRQNSFVHTAPSPMLLRFNETA